MIVLGTVLLNATTARVFAKLAGVFLTKSDGILIIGASRASRLIGQYLETNGRRVVLVDANQNNTEKATELGLEALNINIYSDNLVDNIELNDMGYLIALTGNPEINNYAINKFGTQFGENGSFRLPSIEEINNPETRPKEGLFSHTYDIESLDEVAHNHPDIRELTIKDKAHFQSIMEKLNDDKDVIPLFVKKSNGELEIISSFNTDMLDMKKGFNLVYLGKSI
jgi:hypothetical protein